MSLDLKNEMSNSDRGEKKCHVLKQDGIYYVPGTEKLVAAGRAVRGKLGRVGPRLEHARPGRH